jgi:uncharacterized phage-associated protein
MLISVDAESISKYVPEGAAIVLEIIGALLGTFLGVAGAFWMERRRAAKDRAERLSKVRVAVAQGIGRNLMVIERIRWVIKSGLGSPSQLPHVAYLTWGMAVWLDAGGDALTYERLANLVHAFEHYVDRLKQVRRIEGQARMKSRRFEVSSIGGDLHDLYRQTEWFRGHLWDLLRSLGSAEWIAEIEDEIRTARQEAAALESQSMPNASAVDVARFLVLLASREEPPVRLTNVQVNALLYVVQGWSLARQGRPMFAERIEAWRWGPVVPEVWAEFAQYEGEPIPVPTDVPPLARLDQSFVAAVWQDYNRKAADELLRLVRDSDPYWTPRAPLPPEAPSHAAVQLDVLGDAFRALLPTPLDPSEFEGIRRA